MPASTGASKARPLADQGWTRLYRSIWAHPAFRDEPFADREAWIWLCSQASWQPETVRAGEHLVELDRGEVVGAVRFLATKWQWSKGKVERFLQTLKNQDMIGTRTGTGITVISIRNYDKYQGDGDNDGTLVVQESGQGRDGGGDNIDDVKKGRREEGRTHIPETVPVPANPQKRARKTKTSLDPNWELPEVGWNFARERGWPDQAIRFQVTKFKNHHIGKGNKWADWVRAWYTWVTNDYDRVGRALAPGQRHAAPSRADTAQDGLFSGLTEKDFEPHG